jgi:mannitol-1-phosphate 5-dehydrogenase
VTDKFQDKLVLFGAGKIGRSFIGQLFSRGGYEVVFIDVFRPVIDELNLRYNYNVVIKGDVETVISIQNVRGVFGGDEEKVIHEIVTARIVAVSVGQNGLKSIIPLIAKGLIKRFETADALPLDIIIAENLRNAAEFMNQELKENLPEGYPLEERVGLIETSIGKMVPIMLRKDMDEDILQVFAEPYNTLILDKRAFKNPIPEIEGLAPKENMKAWVDRKLFIHNLGHATAVYLGYLAHPDAIYLYEVLADSQLKAIVRKTMLQAADILLAKYPDEFTIESLTEHIDDLLRRFQNKALGDTLFRVGCDLQRKLSAEDRLAGAIHLAFELKLPSDLILNALVGGCHFGATDEAGNRLPSDLEFDSIYAKGIKEVLTLVCGFDEVIHQELIAKAIQLDDIKNQIK